MSATSDYPSLFEWARRWLARRPHQIIGGEDDPYLLRWYVIPRNPVLNIYVHKFLRDDDRALHDHPWWFVSAILKSGYIEHFEEDGREMMRCRTSVLDVRSPFWWRCIAFRPATWRHRVALPHGFNAQGRADSAVPRVPCWTLIVTGPRVRTWGFWCKDRSTLTYSNRHGSRSLPLERERFIPWDEFDDAGCGER